MSNKCPACQQEAMTSMAKILSRPHVCQHCGKAVRMNLVYTSILSLLYFFLAVKVLLSNGVSGLGMLYVILITVVFVAACVLVPFEEKP